MKWANFQITCIDEWEEYQVSGIDHNFNKILKENHPNKEKTYTYRHKRQKEDQKRKSPLHLMHKTLSIQNKKSVLMAAGEKKTKKENNSWFLNENFERLKNLEQCIPSPKRLWWPSLTNTLCNSIQIAEKETFHNTNSQIKIFYQTNQT